MRYRVRLSEWPHDKWRAFNKEGSRPLSLGEVIHVPVDGGSAPYRIASIEADPDPGVTARIVLARQA